MSKQTPGLWKVLTGIPSGGGIAIGKGDAGLLDAELNVTYNGGDSEELATKVADSLNACEGLADPCAVGELVEAAEKGLRALESHLDESCRDHNLKHRDQLCPCNQNEVKALRYALARVRKQ